MTYNCTNRITPNNNKMIEQKKEENKFRFVLFKNNNTVIDEKYFSADDYNPRVRNSVDVREEVEDIIFGLQETLKSTNNRQQRKEENKFKFILFKNSSTIIERYFSADDYNSRTKTDEEIYNVRDEINAIVNRLQNTLKKRDYEYMWEQYDLEQKGYNKFRKNR